jgi:hypothetical protein
MVLFLLVSKHPRDPYLLSIAAILPILLTTIVLTFRSYPMFSRYFYFVIFIATLFSFSLNVINNGKKHLDRIEDNKTFQHEIQSFLNNYAKSQNLNKDDLKIFWTYGTFSDCYALYFGNDYAKNLFSEEISEICGFQNEFSINVWSKKIFPDNTNIRLNTLDFKAVVIGNPENIYPLDLNDFHEYPSPVINDLSFFVQNKLTQ